MTVPTPDLTNPLIQLAVRAGVEAWDDEQVAAQLRAAFPTGAGKDILEVAAATLASPALATDQALLVDRLLDGQLATIGDAFFVGYVRALLAEGWYQRAGGADTVSLGCALVQLAAAHPLIAPALHSPLAELAVQLGIAFSLQGQLKEAEVSCREALALYTRLASRSCDLCSRPG